MQSASEHPTEAPGRTPERVAIGLGAVMFAAMLPVTLLVAPLKELVGERFGAGDGATHAFMAVNLVGALAVAPVIGWLADHRGRRRTIVSAALAIDAACLALMSLATSLPELFILRFIEGAAHILAISALMAIAADWAPPHRRGRVMGVVGAGLMFGTATGTALGGLTHRLLAARYGAGAVFLVAGLIAAIAAIAAAWRAVESTEKRTTRTRLREIATLLRQEPRLLIPYAYAFVDRMCVGVLVTTFGIFLKDIHGFAPHERGMLFLAFLLPFAALIYPAGRLVDRVGAAWPIAIGSFAFGIAFAAYGLVPREWLAVTMTASGVISAVMFAPNLTLCAELAPPLARGAVYTGFNLAGSLGMLFGPVLGATCLAVFRRAIGGAAAFEATFITTGLAEIVCATVTLPMLLRMAARSRPVGDRGSAG